MPAQTENVQRERLTARKEVLAAVPVAAGQNLLLGALAAVDAAGLLHRAADTAGLSVAGVVWQGLDNTVGPAGTATPLERFAVVETDGQWAFDVELGLGGAVGFGQLAYVVDDHTVTPLANLTTQAIPAGRFVRPSLLDPAQWIVDLLRR